MKVGRQCRDCLITIHKKCEDKFSAENICTHEPAPAKPNQLSTYSDDDLKTLVNIEINNDIPMITTDEIETIPVKLTDDLVVPRTTTANRLSTKAAAAFSVLDSTARRSFRAFGNKSSNQITTPTSLDPSLSSTAELSKSDESLNNSLVPPTKKSPTTNPPAPIPPPVQTSSKLANAASSAYSKLREFKSKKTPATSETNPVRKTRSPSDSSKVFKSFYINQCLYLAPNENIPEADLRDIISVKIQNVQLNPYFCFLEMFIR
jgi:hypothetical protein